MVNWLTAQFYNSRLYLPGFSLSKNTLLSSTGQCAWQLWHWIKVAESTSWQVMQVTTSIISTPKHVCKPRSTFQDHYDTALSDCLNFYFFLQLETGIKTHTVCEVAERVHNTTKIFTHHYLYVRCLMWGCTWPFVILRRTTTTHVFIHICHLLRGQIHTIAMKPANIQQNSDDPLHSKVPFTAFMLQAFISHIAVSRTFSFHLSWKELWT